VFSAGQRSSSIGDLYALLPVPSPDWVEPEISKRDASASSTINAAVPSDTSVVRSFIPTTPSSPVLVPPASVPSSGSSNPQYAPTSNIQYTQLASVPPTNVTMVKPAISLVTAAVSNAANDAQSAENPSASIAYRELKEMLEALMWGCPTHYLFGDNDPVEHRATSCKYNLCNNHDEGWKSWRKGLIFSGGQCWGCGVDPKVMSVAFMLCANADHVAHQGYVRRRVRDQKEDDPRRTNGCELRVRRDAACNGLVNIFPHRTENSLRAVDMAQRGGSRQKPCSSIRSLVGRKEPSNRSTEYIYDRMVRLIHPRAPKTIDQFPRSLTLSFILDLGLTIRIRTLVTLLLSRLDSDACLVTVVTTLRCCSFRFVPRVTVMFTI
jgi:hypothetical protein